jgi:beta-phosphoglucomutase-like phosphatase (HAD superfamily)
VVAIDFDQTLAATDQCWYQADAWVMRDFGIGPQDAIFGAIRHLSLDAGLAALAARVDGSVYQRPTVEELRARFVPVAEELFRRQAAFLPGVHDLLTALEDAGIPRVLVTNSPRRFVDAAFSAPGMRYRGGQVTPDDLFAAAVTADDVAPDRLKPQPDLYDLAFTRLQPRPGHCVAIEDTRQGALAALRATAWAPAVLLIASPGESAPPGSPVRLLQRTSLVGVDVGRLTALADSVRLATPPAHLLPPGTRTDGRTAAGSGERAAGPRPGH